METKHYIEKNEIETYVQPLRSIPALIVNLWHDSRDQSAGSGLVGPERETDVLEAVHGLNLLFDYMENEEGWTAEGVLARIGR